MRNHIQTKQVQLERVEVIPDVRLYGRLGQVGYSLKDALSELVDNAIDARIPHKKLIVDIELDESNQLIRIKDNGRGMTKEELQKALILGKSNKTSKLGFFGLGLKTAGLSLGNIITVKTKTQGQKNLHSIEFDRETFEEKAKWELFIKTINGDIEDIGTTIIISYLNTKMYYQKTDRIIDYFSERYKSFINSGEIEIYINGNKCVPKKTDYIMEEPISIKTRDNNLIKGVLRIQTKRSQKKQEYGFDLYKNKRIITSFDKIGIGNHGEKALICGELNFDFCPVNFTKNAYIKESREYQCAKKAIEDFLKPLIPLFTTKNLKKDKIEKLLELQKETGKIPSLKGFKQLLNYLNNNEGDELIRLNEGERSFDSEETELEKSEDIIFEGIPKHAVLVNQINMNLETFASVSNIIEKIVRDKDTIKDISKDLMVKTIIENYADSLKELEQQTRNLIRVTGV